MCDWVSFLPLWRGKRMANSRPLSNMTESMMALAGSSWYFYSGRRTTIREKRLILASQYLAACWRGNMCSFWDQPNRDVGDDAGDEGGVEQFELALDCGHAGVHAVGPFVGEG